MRFRQRRPRGSLTCRQVGRLLQAYLDGELSDGGTVVVADHLDACLRCGMEASGYRWLKERLAGLGPRTDDRRLDRLRAFANELAGDAA